MHAQPISIADGSGGHWHQHGSRLPARARSAHRIRTWGSELLFNEATDTMEAGDYDQACRALEESQRLDPGVGTLRYLAQCYEEQRRTASAWGIFREASALRA